jgi:hypothetical protein
MANVQMNLNYYTKHSIVIEIMVIKMAVSNGGDIVGDLWVICRTTNHPQYLWVICRATRWPLKKCGQLWVICG